jgi:hypothetical protein
MGRRERRKYGKTEENEEKEMKKRNMKEKG